MQPIIVCLSSDNNYAQHGAVVIESILANHQLSKPIEIHYMDGGIAEDHKARLQEVVDRYQNACLRFHTMGNAYQEFFVDRHISHAAYYRLKIDQLLPHADKAIYLDTDVVVLDDIEHLWNVDITGYSLGGVEDVGLRRRLAATKERLSMPSDAHYINSGVLIMNLARWREKNLGEAILDYLKTHPNLAYHDQDALNAVLWNDTFLLHPKWNTFKGIFHYYYKKKRTKYLTRPFIEAAKSPSIVHFTGPIKPWHYACGMPYTEAYYAYLSNTPYKGYTPSDKTLKSFLKRWEWKIRRILFS